MSYMIQNFRVFHVSNVSVLSYRFFLLMYSKSLTRRSNVRRRNRSEIQTRSRRASDRCLTPSNPDASGSDTSYVPGMSREDPRARWHVDKPPDASETEHG